jgi:hypothetical protein
MSDTKIRIATSTEERELARVTLRKLLDGKKKGDRITASEIVDATGFDDWRSFGDTVRRWGAARGFEIVAVVNDGWRIVVDREHADVAVRRLRSAAKKEVRAHRAVRSADTSQLTDAEMRRHTFVAGIAARREREAVADERTVRKELKLGSDRVPLRISGGSD